MTFEIWDLNWKKKIKVFNLIKRTNCGLSINFLQKLSSYFLVIILISHILKNIKILIYLVLPVNRIHVHKRWDLVCLAKFLLVYLKYFLMYAWGGVWKTTKSLRKIQLVKLFLICWKIGLKLGLDILPYKRILQLDDDKIIKDWHSLLIFNNIGIVTWF